MTPDDALTYLLDLPRYAGQPDDAYKPGLERMTALMGAMGRPHEAFESVHVAGTNGKGSTASMIAAIATASGRRVGLHTSPHFLHLTERMRIDGTPAPDAWLADAVARFQSDFDELQPSFFEATVALSFLYFAEQQVDIAVVEVGLGGRLDATNVLRPALACITTIDLDHTNILGDTLAAIAREKAGIIKAGVPVVTGADQPEVLAVLRDVAAAHDAPLHVVADEVEVLRADTDLHGTTLEVRTPRRRYEGLRVGLSGAYQQANAAVALRAAEGLAFGADAIAEGLRHVRALAGVHGRFEVLQTEPLIVADAAHNPAGVKAALMATQDAAAARGGQLTVALGGVRDKDVGAMARVVAEAGAPLIPLSFASPRAMPADEVATQAAEAGAAVEPSRTIDEALAHFRRTAAPADVLLLTGSHGVVIPLLEERDNRS